MHGATIKKEVNLIQFLSSVFILYFHNNVLFPSSNSMKVFDSIQSKLLLFPWQTSKLTDSRLNLEHANVADDSLNITGPNNL
jgi:hypothetical protein